MTTLITPPIGAKGLFDLAAPFDRFVEAGVEYTCMAIRRLSDYVAANEKPDALIYDKYGIKADYDDDMASDAYIVSLQSRRGHWLHVPQKYVLSFPSGSGHRYRAMSLVFKLPPVPVNIDTSPLQLEIEGLIKARLGVSSKSAVVDTSLVTLVTDEKHIEVSTRRSLEKAAGTTWEELGHLRHHNQELLSKVAALEAELIRLRS